MIPNCSFCQCPRTYVGDVTVHSSVEDAQHCEAVMAERRSGLWRVKCKFKDGQKYEQLCATIQGAYDWLDRLDPAQRNIVHCSFKWIKGK